MAPFGKLLIVAGLILAGAGVAILFADKVPWLGRLPGDITIKRDNFTFYFPVVTCLIVSVILSLIVWLLRK